MLLSLAGAAVIGVFTFVRMSAFDVPLAIHLACAAIAAGPPFLFGLGGLPPFQARFKKSPEQPGKEVFKKKKKH